MKQEVKKEKNKKSEEDESENKDSEELEEQVENVHNEIDESRFMEFLQSGRNIAPVLEKVQTANTTLEEEVPAARTEPERENFQTNYASFADTEEESRVYQSQPPVLRPISRGENPGVGLIDPMRQRGFVNDDVHPRMVETGAMNTERKLPFDEQKKYKEVRFKKFV